MQPPQHVQYLGMHARHADFLRRLLALLLNERLDLLSRIVEYFLDTLRMNSPVRDQLVQRLSGNFAPNRIKATNDHHTRGVIDNDIDAGHLLKGTNVASLVTDDPPFHLVARYIDGARRALSGVCSRISLQGR